MTTVERYFPTSHTFPPDVPLSAQRSRSRRKDVPPAVPDPPSTSSRNSPPRKRPSSETNTQEMASEDSSQWLFTESELASTPSILDGLPIAEERCRRAKGVNFILQAGILLKLPQITIATAAVFFNRFYMRQSMVAEKTGIHHYSIAATSLFLATKTEENCRKTKEIVIAVAKVAQKNASLIIDEQSKEYWRWRDNILMYEELMLELLTFDVVLQSPYTFLHSYVRQLQVIDNKVLRNSAWAFINDSCLTTLCLLVPPKHIAIAAIYFAAAYTKEKIPDDLDHLPWWEQVGGSPDWICKAVNVMNDFYHENPLKKTDAQYSQSPKGSPPMSISQDDVENTRSGFGGDTPASEPGLQFQNGHLENGETRTPIINSYLKEEREASPITSKRENGSSDKQLKEAANDPATHEDGSHPNGMSEIITTTEMSHETKHTQSPKRKLGDSREGPAAKKVKLESNIEAVSDVVRPSTEGAPNAEPVKENDLEDGEEGEVAE